MKLEYTEQARTDIVEIGEYIAEDNPPRARSFLAELRAFIEQIPENPRRYRLREEWGGAVRAARRPVRSAPRAASDRRRFK